MRGDMLLRQAERSGEMDQAHADRGVTDAAAAFLAVPSDGMLRLLAATIQNRYDARSHRDMILTAGIPNEAHHHAYDLLAAMNSIWDDGRPDVHFCRGALLEKIALGLMQRRPDPITVLAEQRVGPFPDPPWDDGVSDPIDYVVPETPEFYECKVGIFWIKSKHLEQFRLIKGLDPLSLTGFVTLAKAATLTDLLTEFIDVPPIHAFTLEDFLALSEGPASMRVA